MSKSPEDLITEDGRVDARLISNANRAKISPSECAEIRSRLVEQNGPVDRITEELGIDWDSQTHYRGGCQCDHDTPPVIYDFAEGRWRFRND